MNTLIVNSNELLTKSELVDFYKDIAQQQGNNYTTLITVLLGVTVVLIGSTWLWNFILAKKQINEEVNTLFNQSIDDSKKQLQQIVDDRFAELEKQLENKLKMNEANLARLYAINCSNQNLYSTSISWWITALKIYSEIEDQIFIRISVEQILNNINQENWNLDINENFDITIAIQEIETIVPDLLTNEKRQIINRFRALLN